MMNFSDLLQQGESHLWLFIPSAILLGALHGLEPGHSKTMMAAFIIAIRGTVWQAVLLGLSAAVSHTAVVWAIALGGMYFWRGIDTEAIEPYFQIASAVMILAIAAWTLWRIGKDRLDARLAHGDHHHAHAHGEDIRRIDTGHGVVSLEVYEDGVPPRWRVRFESGQSWAADEVNISTERPNGSRQAFVMINRGAYLESIDEIPEPHEFMARVCVGHGGHTHDYDLAFVENHGHDHDHIHEEMRGLEVTSGGYQDAHELAHANDIRRRFADRNVTTGQIVLFGLTGGLVPCPASTTVLLICLQLKQITLGAILVFGFSIGLALTMVTVGAVAALSVQHAQKNWRGFSALVARAPYASVVLIALVGLYTGYIGWMGLSAQHL